MRKDRYVELNVARHLWGWTAQIVNNLPYVHAVIAQADAARKAQARQYLPLRAARKETGTTQLCMPRNCPAKSHSVTLGHHQYEDCHSIAP